MKFRFCGDLDCPDWVLAEISVLSKLSNMKMKSLAMRIIESLESEKSRPFDLRALFDQVGISSSHDAQAQFALSDMKGSVAAIEFLLTCAVRHSPLSISTTSSETSSANAYQSVLATEWQQLGLPKEHASTLSRLVTQPSKYTRILTDVLAERAQAISSFLSSFHVLSTQIHISPKTQPSQPDSDSRPVVSCTFLLSPRSPTLKKDSERENEHKELSLAGNQAGSGRMPFRLTLVMSAEQALVLHDQVEQVCKYLELLALQQR